MNAGTKTQTFNGRVEWIIGGAGYFKLLRSVTAVDIELWNAGRLVLNAPSAESGFFQNIAFDRVVITAPSDQLVVWLHAPSAGGLDRIVIDTRRVLFADDETDNGRAFSGTVTQPAVAAEFSHVQLMNPAASGKVVYLDKITVFGAAANADVGVAVYNTELTTNFGALRNKYADGALSTCTRRRQSNAAALGNEFIARRTLANAEAFVEINPPLRLDAGKGAVVRQGTVNLNLTVTFEAREYNA